MARRLIILVGVFTLLVSGACAQHAHQAMPIGDGQADVSIDLVQPFGASTPPKISGTNVNVVVGCYGVAHDGATLSVNECHLFVGGEELALPAAWHGGTVRFASTHFPDSNDALQFEVHATFTYDDPPHGFTGTVVVDTILELDPFNKVFRYGTGVGENGKPSSVHSSTSTSLCNQVDWIMPALQHGNVPPLVLSHDFKQWDTYDVLNGLTNATVEFNLAHGYPLVYNVSDLVSQSGGDPAHEPLRYTNEMFLPPSNIEAATGQGQSAGNPLMNLVYHWSCDVLDGLDPRPALHWIPFPEDRAVVGFTATVNCMMRAGDRTPDILQSTFDSNAGDHAHVFLNQLLVGARLFEALGEANLEYPPRGAAHLVNGVMMRHLLDMTTALNHDTRLRLKNVYLKDSAEEAACLAARGTIDTWYWVKP